MVNRVAADFYAELGVGRSASDDEVKEVKKTYKKLADELHPDRNQDKRGVPRRQDRGAHPHGLGAAQGPPGAQNGQLLRLRGKSVTRGDKQGDLYVRFLIRLPQATSTELEAAVRALGAAAPSALRDDIRF